MSTAPSSSASSSDAADVDATVQDLELSDFEPPLHRLHPDCDQCLRIDQDQFTYRDDYDREKPFQYRGDRRAVNLSKLFHGDCVWRSDEVQWRVRGPELRSWSAKPVEFVLVQKPQSGFEALGDSVREAVDQTVQDWKPLKACLEQCRSTHSSCNSGRDLVLPSKFRVIDVPNRRLLAPNMAAGPNTLEYVALSYVWGEVQDGSITKLTKGNLSSLSEAINVSSLPATIRDAINVCDNLGLQYLWVDRFCILQDDDGDKSSQIQAMSEIFSTAKMILVAACGIGMDSGLTGVSQPRDPQISRIVSGAGIQVNLQRPPLWDAINASAWNSRGWTYQEAILNRRKLFFTKSQIYFECAVRITHEENLSYPLFDPSLHDKVRYPSSTTSLSYSDYDDGHDRFKQNLLARKTEHPWDAYKRHLWRYRARNLSHASDLVNAFSGILNSLYSRESVYYGLPLLELDKALLWVPNRFQPRPTESRIVNKVPQPTTSDFPSWSWASAPNDKPNLGVMSVDHGLCLWFRPVVQDDDMHNLRLQPILPLSVSPRSDVPPGFICSSSINLHTAKALIGGLIEHAGIDHNQLANWEALTASELESAVFSRWDTYHKFWVEIFGNRFACMVATSLDVPVNTLRDGMLVTRAQVAQLRIAPGDRDDCVKAKALNQKDEDIKPIKSYVYDNDNQIAWLLRNGQEIFDFMALSISQRDRFGLQPVVGHRDNEGILPKTVAFVNTMIVKREGPYYKRIGLTRLYMKSWVDLRAPFKTVLLI
ncbi:heterokaryon incompatibility protein-domain-containing protein [Bombardia bombarda]|uniref:Heterokaryon incompatibility protein-domain-containing protein n=1 Tax=Bombardia bombarda TaxID=252184 RepID=A0AA40CDT4_9PEZI|nr:heterokaryon incompatibility protein-domain-containing protein [Bombardia bombarda]